jgi:GT2 family glycosyltransferase
MGTPFRSDYDVDILVRGVGTASLTDACLRSIYNNTAGPSFLVTYVDGGTPLTDFQALVQHFPQAQFVRLPFNHGSVRAINYGLSIALWSTAPYILLLDNDTEVPEGDTDWLTRFVSYLADSRVAAAGAVTDYVAGAQNVRAYPDRVQGRPPLQPPVLVSFAMLLRKAAVEKVQFFDERYEPGNFEDYDYCLQLRQAGYTLVVADSVWLYHRGSQTFARLGHTQLLAENERKFIDKWGAATLRQAGLDVQQRGAADGEQGTP